MLKITNIKLKVDNVDFWFKIDNDGAFEDIIFGWKEKGKEAYTKYLKNKDTVIQAGGYCGIFPRLFSDIFFKVYTFEPDPANFYCLSLNCMEKSNIIKMQCALGSGNGEMISVYSTHSNNRGMNKIIKNNSAYIPMMCIDSFNFANCDLIQLDTEGCEYDILQGAKNTIEKFLPVISVEDTNKDIENFLKRYGYQLKETVYRDYIYAV